MTNPIGTQFSILQILFNQIDEVPEGAEGKPPIPKKNNGDEWVPANDKGANDDSPVNPVQAFFNNVFAKPFPIAFFKLLDSALREEFKIRFANQKKANPFDMIRRDFEKQMFVKPIEGVIMPIDVTLKPLTQGNINTNIMQLIKESSNDVSFFRHALRNHSERLEKSTFKIYKPGDKSIPTEVHLAMIGARAGTIPSRNEIYLDLSRISTDSRKGKYPPKALLVSVLADELVHVIQNNPPVKTLKGFGTTIEDSFNRIRSEKYKNKPTEEEEAFLSMLEEEVISGSVFAATLEGQLDSDHSFSDREVDLTIAYIRQAYTKHVFQRIFGKELKDLPEEDQKLILNRIEQFLNTKKIKDTLKKYGVMSVIG